MYDFLGMNNIVLQNWKKQSKETKCYRWMFGT